MRILKIKFDAFLFFLAIGGFSICLINANYANTGLSSEFRHVYFLELPLSFFFLLASVSSDKKDGILSRRDWQLLRMLRFQVYLWLGISVVYIIGAFANFATIGLARSFLGFAIIMLLLPLGSSAVLAYHFTAKMRTEDKENPASWVNLEAQQETDPTSSDT